MDRRRLWQPDPMELVARRSIAAPAGRVWALITDLESSPRIMSAIVSVDRLGGPEEFGVGTRWRETRTMFGRAATEEMTVTGMTPGQSYTVVADGNGTRYESELLVAEDGPNTCTISMTFRGIPTSPVSHVLSATIGRLFTGATRKALEQDLADLAAAAEGSAG